MQKPRHSIYTLSLFSVLGSLTVLGCSQFLNTSYEPSSPEIERLAIATAMTPDAQQLFYKQEPKIKPKEQFHTLCHKSGRDREKTIILGCFTSNGYKGNIVIQSVTEPRLQGMMEVVAAHEMLHAAYQELGKAERARLAPKLRKAAQRVKDSHLSSILEAYEAGDPEIYLNELHAYLGTELSDLGDPDLEQHYRQYFQDRQQVIALAQRSRSVLAQLEAQATQLKPEIDALEVSLKEQKNVIRQADSELDTRQQRLQQMKADLRSLKQRAEASLRQGDSSLVQEFEYQKDRFNREVRQYNLQTQNLQERVAQINQQVETYKQKVDAYNNLAETNRSILKSLKVEEAEYDVSEIAP
ncbi:Chromosome partition protein Smc [Acaryochloris thomasi RCC1774]|uniref:Chromosome partition protein Smc n=1 Tax=Acaryochloris thomasi RCC1774 TaxID=1764569 RepID=A0A2W1JJV6_9CYAN|nr:hypothetical protein [Acaryochloris thomasi]PZD71765.1 Chromosome partition protein Smc [Acaryochloris thomasi RCC1774]